MNLARLHGKGTNDDLRHEDPLVAEVLGVLRYLPSAAAPVVRRASRATGSLGDWAAELGVDLHAARAELRLWPGLAGREPDALLLFFRRGDSSPCASVLIEAKFHAPQHSIPDETGQHLPQAAWYHAAHRRWAWREPLAAPPESARATVLLTAHAWEPDAVDALHQQDATASIFWLSWEAVGRGLSETWESAIARVADEPWLRLLEDALRCLDARGLRERPFRGMPSPPLPPDFRPRPWRGIPRAPAPPAPFWRPA